MTSLPASSAASHLAASAALVLAGVACERGERRLFGGLDVEVGAGRVAWLRGANGQGKTTLLRTLAGLARPSAGTIELRGAAAAWPRLYLAHANALKDDLSAAEALGFLLRLGGAGPADDPTVTQALERFGMAGRRHAPVRSLSQGQRRRVALARLAALPVPALWLLDEPYDALDADGVARLDGVLGEHVARGGIVVLTSHLALSSSAPAPIEVQLGGPA